MHKTSIIIAAYKEPFLQRTIEDICVKMGGEIEIIVVLDGYWPNPPIKDNKRVITIHRSERQGMRKAINSAVRISKGKYLFKCDAHCAFDDKIDLKLAEECQPDWVVIPVRYSLNTNDWTRDERKKREFQYIEKGTLKGRGWPEYEQRVNGQMVVDLMTSQGSCWFMHKKWFKIIGWEDDINYGWMGREAQEVCLKTWLSGGRYVLNRKTWYAHWDKPVEHVIMKRSEKDKSINYAVDFWMNKWKGEKDLNWLVQKFAPVPSWE